MRFYLAAECCRFGQSCRVSTTTPAPRDGAIKPAQFLTTHLAAHATSIYMLPTALTIHRDDRHQRAW